MHNCITATALEEAGNESKVHQRNDSFERVRSSFERDFQQASVLF
jgi:hypothetical protein